MDFGAGEDPVFGFGVGASSVRASSSGIRGPARKKKLFAARTRRTFGRESYGRVATVGGTAGSCGTPSASQSSSGGSHGGSSISSVQRSGTSRGSDSGGSSSSSGLSGIPTRSHKAIRSSVRRKIRLKRGMEEEERGDKYSQCRAMHSDASFSFGEENYDNDSNTNSNGDTYHENENEYDSPLSSPSGPVTIVRTGHSVTGGSMTNSHLRERLSVRRGAPGFSAFAVQDAGTYQMLHDECSYLCSTVLSRRVQPSRALDAAVDLAVLLSSRKTRRMLWRGDSRGDGVGEAESDMDATDASQRLHGRDPPPPGIPKLWSSVFEVLALVGARVPNQATRSRSPWWSKNASDASLSMASSNASSGGDPGPRTSSARSTSRTKSARRREKELSSVAGGSGCTTAAAGTSSTNKEARAAATSAVLADVCACIAHWVSWDCTLSTEHSVAAMGPVRSPSLARRIRAAVLERGPVLAGIAGLMASHHANAPPIVHGGKGTGRSSSGFAAGAPVSPLRTGASPPPRRRTRRLSAAASKAIDSRPTKNVVPATQPVLPPSKAGGDPTAAGRRNRKKRRRRTKTESPLDSVAEKVDCPGLEDARDSDSALMPPPTNRRSRRRSQTPGAGDELSFSCPSVAKEPLPSRTKPTQPSGGEWGTDESSSVVSEALTEETSVVASRISQKVDELRARVCIESNDASYAEKNCPVGGDFFPAGDRPWTTTVCLESITRILTGKELNGKTSCLEEEASEGTKGGGDESDGADDENGNGNVYLVTNRLVGKSGIIPILTTAMSETMAAATKLVFPETVWSPENDKSSESTGEEEKLWRYCHIRLQLLASLIDEACFFSDQNRRRFCEEDPFSFEDQKKGMIYYILVFLHRCSGCDLNRVDQKRSETMSLALRTLTSLTHNNPLAAEQMSNSNDDLCAEGINVLANVVFHLEDDSLSSNKRKRTGPTTNLHGKAKDHDMHRYDGTIFCLTTLANIIEGSGVRRSLIEIENIGLQSGANRSWLQWLCQWIVNQTESFRHEILSIGCKSERSSSKGIDTAGDEDGELLKHEEEMLVAAGNGCVVLACLMTEADNDDPESSAHIRKLVENEMPLDPGGNSSRLALVVNTLKAYCNYYHISMGQMSFAVVAPVKKLIDELEDMINFDESKSID